MDTDFELISQQEGGLTYLRQHVDISCILDDDNEAPIVSGEIIHELIRVHYHVQLPSAHNVLTARGKPLFETNCPSSVNKHTYREPSWANIMTKLNIKDTANLTKYAIRLGYTSVSS